ncbi:MAG: hypothetical protein GY913_26525 [Proteobacteria bacterium]|nr:hypothetical protein [Pseudomonadota bacterium]MCP4920473.1 hypothetical protein [Pseudomonadota bacterium]
MSIAERITAIRRRVAWAAFGGAALRHAAVALFLSGTAVLVFRLWLRDAWWPALIPLAVVPLTALVVARARFITDATAAAWLDRAGGGRGDVLTALEKPDPRWPVPASVAAPTLSLPWTWPLPGAGFLAVAFLIPVSAPPTPPAPAIPEATIEHLDEQLEALDEVAELDEAEVEAIEENIRDLEKATEATEAQLEALDATEDRMGRMAEDLDDAAKRAEDAMARARDGQAPPEKAMQQALDALQEVGFSLDLPPELAEKLKDMPRGEAGQAQMSELSAEQMQALGDAIQQAIDQGRVRLESAELIEGEGTCDNPSECDVALSLAGSGDPGQGGITRGPGTADLTFGDEAEDRSALFQPTILPPGAELDLEHTMLLGEAFADAEVDPTRQFAGAEATSMSAGDATWHRDLAPEHRDAVSTFFAADDTE